MNFQQAVLKAGRVADFKFYLEMQRIKNNQSNLGEKKKKKNKQRTQPDFETYKDTIVKEICFWWKNR